MNPVEPKEQEMEQERGLMKRESTFIDSSSNSEGGKIAKILGFFRLKVVLQRLPGVFTIGFLLLCFFGPMFTPILYTVYFLWIHIYFMWSTLRTMISACSTYFAVVAHTRIDWRAKFDAVLADKVAGDDNVMRFEDVVHVIIIPQYKEDLDTMNETLSVLASHTMAKTNYKICLAMEEGEKEAPEKAAHLKEAFKDAFMEIVHTLHPKGIPGEIRGKSSNTAWAAKEMVGQGPLANQVLTVMDADTCFAADYFEAISFNHASASEKERGLLYFCTPTLFDRNADKVPLLVRAYDMQWSMGVMQFPCSAYSLSADLAYAVGLWDVGAEAIGEDLHMFLKCFYSTQAQLMVRPIFSPASQCNIEGRGCWGGITARYTQSKRHMWAALDVGYCIRRTLFSLLAPGFDAPLRNSSVIPIKISPLSSYNILSLLWGSWSIVYSVFEGHFFVTQTLILIATSSVLIPPGLIPGIAPFYWSSLTSSPVHPILDSVNGAANYMRLVASAFYVVGVFFYEKYQAHCGIYRWQDPNARTKLGIRSRLQFSRPWYAVLDWFSFPITGVLYLVLPQLQVHISQLFTENLDYVVAAKPTLSPATVEPDVSDDIDSLTKPAPLNKEASAVTIVVVDRE